MMRFQVAECNRNTLIEILPDRAISCRKKRGGAGKEKKKKWRIALRRWMEMEYFQLYIYIYITRDNEANGQENLYHQIPYVGRG